MHGHLVGTWLHHPERCLGSLPVEALAHAARSPRAARRLSSHSTAHGEVNPPKSDGHTNELEGLRAHLGPDTGGY